MLIFNKLIKSASVACVKFATMSQYGQKMTILNTLSNVRADPIHESIVKQFPDYEIVFEYMGVSELGAKIANEGDETEVDIMLDMGYAYLESLKD